MEAAQVASLQVLEHTLIGSGLSDIPTYEDFCTARAKIAELLHEVDQARLMVWCEAPYQLGQIMKCCTHVRYYFEPDEKKATNWRVVAADSTHMAVIHIES